MHILQRRIFLSIKSALSSLPRKTCTTSTARQSRMVYSGNAYLELFGMTHSNISKKTFLKNNNRKQIFCVVDYATPLIYITCRLLEIVRRRATCAEKLILLLQQQHIPYHPPSLIWLLKNCALCPKVMPQIEREMKMLQKLLQAWD